MANRDNHYEAAFEQFLRSRGVPYVAVDEAKRSLMSDGASIKSLDFIVSTPSQITWLVDVKGRRFPSGDEQKQYWKNWSTHDDLESLTRWEAIFGAGFRGLSRRGSNRPCTNRCTRLPRCERNPDMCRLPRNGRGANRVPNSTRHSASTLGPSATTRLASSAAISLATCNCRRSHHTAGCHHNRAAVISASKHQNGSRTARCANSCASIDFIPTSLSRARLAAVLRHYD